MAGNKEEYSDPYGELGPYEEILLSSSTAGTSASSTQSGAVGLQEKNQLVEDDLEELPWVTALSQIISSVNSIIENYTLGDIYVSAQEELNQGAPLIYTLLSDLMKLRSLLAESATDEAKRKRLEDLLVAARKTLQSIQDDEQSYELFIESLQALPQCLNDYAAAARDDQPFPSRLIKKTEPVTDVNENQNSSGRNSQKSPIYIANLSTNLSIGLHQIFQNWSARYKGIRQCVLLLLPEDAEAIEFKRAAEASQELFEWNRDDEGDVIDFYSHGRDRNVAFMQMAWFLFCAATKVHEQCVVLSHALVEYTLSFEVLQPFEELVLLLNRMEKVMTVLRMNAGEFTAVPNVSEDWQDAIIKLHQFLIDDLKLTKHINKDLKRGNTSPRGIHAWIPSLPPPTSVASTVYNLLGPAGSASMSSANRVVSMGSTTVSGTYKSAKKILFWGLGKTTSYDDDDLKEQQNHEEQNGRVEHLDVPPPPTLSDVPGVEKNDSDENGASSVTSTLSTVASGIVPSYSMRRLLRNPFSTE